MSILIKGMNISKKDAESCVCTIKTLRNLAYNTQGVLDWVDHANCDKIIEMLELLVEIPTPHGRLKDVDRIEYENVYFEDVGESYEMVGKDDIDELPTVIEAEGSEE